MPNAVLILIVAALFYGLSLAADVVVSKVKHLAQHLGVAVAFIGLLLGLLTSLPEMAIGVNALVKDVPDLSLGNLLGGILVLFLLVLGGSAVLHQRIRTDGRASTIVPLLLFLTLPLALGLDGAISFLDGAILVPLYVALLWYLSQHEYLKHHHVTNLKQTSIGKDTAIAILAVTAIVILSSLIIRFTLQLLSAYQISPFFIGVIAVSIGTCLPEMIVAVRSWKKGLKDLSLGNLLGSAMANIFIIGAFALFKPFNVVLDSSFIFLAGSIIVTLILVLLFYRSKKSISALEGACLLVLYAAFVVGQSLLPRALP